MRARFLNPLLSFSPFHCDDVSPTDNTPAVLETAAMSQNSVSIEDVDEAMSGANLVAHDVLRRDLVERLG